MYEAALSYGRMEGRPLVGEGSQTERETVDSAGVLYAAGHAVELSPARYRWGIREDPFQRLQGLRW
jgi:hypothetical protein